MGLHNFWINCSGRGVVDIAADLIAHPLDQLNASIKIIFLRDFRVVPMV